MRNNSLVSSVFPEKKSKKREGFTLLEVVIGIALVGIALLGLAQMFTYSVANNARSDRMTSSVYLAQEQIDSLRSLTSAELNALTAGIIDEQVDVNRDGTYDFRRLTKVQQTGVNWTVRVLIFAETQFGEDVSLLLNNPVSHKVKADVNTIISR